MVCALKIVKSAAHYTEAAEDEVRTSPNKGDRFQNFFFLRQIKILQCCAKHDTKGEQPVVHMHDSFYHRGVNGKRIADSCRLFA